MSERCPPAFGASTMRLSRGESLAFAGAFGGTAFRLSPLAKLRFALKWR